MALSSTKIIKVIVVTDDLDRTVSAYRTLLGVDREPEPANLPHNQVRAPYTRYLGRDITDTPMRAASVCSENSWFEIIQPLGHDDPWAAWLAQHGTSICSICLMTDGPIEADEAVLEGAGFLCCVLCGSLVDNAALGQLGVSPAKVIAFGNNQDLVPGVSQGKSRGTAGQPRADDQNGYVIACFCHDKKTSAVCAFPAVSQPSGMKGRNGESSFSHYTADTGKRTDSFFQFRLAAGFQHAGEGELRGFAVRVVENHGPVRAVFDALQGAEQLFGRDFRHIGAERVFPVQEGHDGAAVHVASGEAFHEIALRAHHEQAVSVSFLREAGGVLDKG